MANYLKPHSPLQHKDGDYFYPLTTVDQIITDNDTRLNAELISIDLKDSVESDKIVLGTQAIPISIQEGGTNANNAAEARENLGITPENIGAISMELLWENASPSSDFAAQTIALDLSQIDVVKVVYKVMTTSDNEYTFEASVNRSATIINFVNASFSSTTQVSSRDLTINPDGIIFKDSLNKQITSSSAASTSNSRIIPIKIYGVKGVTV